MKNWIVTGGAGCGKSMFCEIVGETMKPMIRFFSCDEAVHEIWDDPGTRDKLAVEFAGELAKNIIANVSRRAMRNLVFAESGIRERLEGIIHPLVFNLLDEERATAQKAGAAKVFLAEVPLYYESLQSLAADTVIVVAASRTVQQTRLIEHRKLDANVSEGMLNAQLPLELKIDKADVVVWNDGSSAILEAQALLLLGGRCEF